MAASKPVLAYFHTFPLYPSTSGGTTYDTWLTPATAAAYGGKWRQRPYPIIRGTTTNTTRIAYAKQDIAMAANIGIDAFAFNCMHAMFATETFRYTEHVLPYYDAAAEFSTENTPGFKICPNMDMLSISTNGGTAAQWASNMQPLLAHAAAYKIDGRPVVCLYNVDDRPATWYSDFASALAATHGIANVLLIPSHQATSPTAGNNMDNYVSLFTSGLFKYLHAWNAPLHTESPSTIYDTWRTWCANNGALFCCTTGPGWNNDRPELLKQKEGYGTKILENQWASAIEHDDPMLQIVSWSDHLEAHNIRPATGYQFVPSDITAYYLAWFKTGTAPTITRDALFYAHRMHRYFKADGVTVERDATVQTGGAYSVVGGPPVDLIIVTAFLTAGADVIITTGGTDKTFSIATSGVHRITTPMVANDTPSFRVVRGGSTVVPSFSSAFPIRSNVTYQDLAYRMGSSTRLPVSEVQSDLPQDR